MSRKTRSKEQKEREIRAAMDPRQRELLEQRELAKRELLEKQRAERREQQERALGERLRKKRLKQLKKGLAIAAVPVGLVALIIILITVLRPVTTVFSHSDWLDDRGFWKGIRALDYADSFDYDGLQIPADVHQVSDDEVQREIDYILSEFAMPYHITDRPVMDGDEVNIDFVGSIDGEEFPGGSTEGMGEDVTIGLTEYIDDFLEQLVGHTPGETIDVEVTFPEDYHEESLQGKEAVFITTINYIKEDSLPEFNDEFVREYLTAEHGWSTTREMWNDISSKLKQSAIEEYVIRHLAAGAGLHSIPNPIIEYQKLAMLSTYQGYADSYGMSLDEFISVYVGYADAEDLVESSQDAFVEGALYALAIQAVAEDAGLSVSGDDLTAFFIEETGDGDYSLYEQQYGLPYLKQLALNKKVVDYVVGRAVLS